MGDIQEKVRNIEFQSLNIWSYKFAVGVLSTELDRRIENAQKQLNGSFAKQDGFLIFNDGIIDQLEFRDLLLAYHEDYPQYQRVKEGSPLEHMLCGKLSKVLDIILDNFIKSDREDIDSIIDWYINFSDEQYTKNAQNVAHNYIINAVQNIGVQKFKDYVESDQFDYVAPYDQVLKNLIQNIEVGKVQPFEIKNSL